MTDAKEDKEDVMSSSDSKHDEEEKTEKDSGKEEKKKGKPSLKDIKKRGREILSAKRRNNEDDISIQVQQMVIDDTPPPSVQGTGIIYDERMLKHGRVYDSEPGQSEHPQRISACYEQLKQCGILDRCQQLPGRQASIEELKMLHSEDYIDLIKRTSEMSVEELRELAETYDSVCLSPNTFETASVTAGCAISLVEQIVSQKIRNGVVIARPPGHHAQRSMACGYGYFNNIALAAYHARYKLNIQRVLIVDWDVHHGQGTQYFFEDDPSILYFSIHRYENGGFWPHLHDSNYDKVGTGNGVGFNINVPWNKVGMGDSEYIAAFQQILLPIAYEFDPELVLVSAGFDSGLADPKGEMSISMAGYAHLTHMLMSVSQGRLALVLEGGYNIKTLSESLAMCVRILLGEPCPPVQTNKPCDSAIQSILDVISVHRQFWNCLKYQVFPTDHDTMTVGVEINDDNPEVQEEIKQEDEVFNRLVSELKFSTPVHRTALVYDERMRKHRDQWNTSHPERPDRITTIFQKHESWKLLDRCFRVEGRMATDEEILTLHSSHHLEKMKESQGMKNRELFQLQMEYNSIYFHETSYECASLAAGSVLNVVKEVLSGQVQNGVCITRPPGHHAEAKAACGFCFFNNVALAARFAQNNFGLKRILIIDWDVHHGNGIQHMFDDDNSVLYISLHRYDYGMFYPGSPDADYDKVGKGKGKGFNVNIAWNGGRMGDAEYIAAFQQIIMPIAMEFSPELVLVSAGFDAAKGDPLGGYMITPEGYAHMTHMLSSLANGRVVIVLEGGYNLNSISLSMAMCTKILLGDTCPSMQCDQPSPSAIQCILNTLHVHHKYWQSLQFQVTLPDVEVLTLPDVEVLTNTGETAKEEDNETSKNKVSADGDAGADVIAIVTDEKLEEAMAAISISDCNTKTGETDKISENREQTQVSEQRQEIQTSCLGNQGREFQVTEEQNVETIGSQEKLKDTNKIESMDETEATATASSVIQDQVTMYAVVPLNYCPHLDMVCDVPTDGVNTQSPCSVCGDCSENWLCLSCYQVYCGRYVNEHMVEHYTTTNHPMTLSYSDLSVWCYVCDSYVHNERLLAAKRAAHRSKFGEDMAGQH